jgi:large subunit ribosomal protein L4
MKLDVLNIQGQKTGRSVELPDDIFGIEPNTHTIYLAVKQYLAHQRQGTHKSKERSEMSGSTRKLIKQKGTGGARKGDINSPTMVGGGRAFGPKPHDYVVKLNKKVKHLARKSAFSTIAKTGAITVVEDFTFSTPKTSQFVNILNSVGVGGKKAIFVLTDQDDNVYKSGRNIERLSIVRAGDLNTYQILNTRALVLTEGSIAKIQETFA